MPFYGVCTLTCTDIVLFQIQYTWETRVAGKHLPTAVPVQWRGCSAGCLDFLDIVPGGDTTTDESDLEPLAPVPLNKGLAFSDDEGGW